MTTGIIPTFDYGGLDAETRIVVQQRTGEIRTIARRAAADIIEIGGKLNEVKDRLGHGRFGDWLKAEFGWSQDTAGRFMAVAAKFGQIPQIAEFAPSALYLLAGPSVPDAARAEAIQVVEAGERVTVARAASIVAEHKPEPAPVYLTGDELSAAVRPAMLALAGGEEHLRAVLTQINIGSPGGQGYLTKLTAALPGKARPADVLALCRAWLAELLAADRPAARAVAFSPAGESLTPIWQLEQGIRRYLDARRESLAAGETSLAQVQAMAARTPGQGRVDLDDLRHNGDWLRQPYREGDLQQALNNVRVQLAQAAKVEGKVEAEPGLRSLAAVNAAAEALLPRIWKWLAVPLAASADDWAKAARLTASLLDVEGFHAARGRNFDLEALIGFLGADCDREALPVAVSVVRAVIQQNLAAAEQAATEPEPEPETDPEPDVIGQWLAALAEENEIPAGRDGQPERDAVRTVLKAIINDRANGGVRYYRSLFKHPAWPAGTDERTKLTAVRQALAAMTGEPEPVAERRPPSWAGLQPVSGGHAAPAVGAPRTAKDATVALIQRKDQHIRHLVVAVDKALGYLGSLAEQRNGAADEDLLECISALRLARAEALNED